MRRSRLSAGLLAVLVTAGVVGLSAGSATAGPTTEDVAGPTSQAQGARTLALSESTGLPEAGASITVTGSGFDPAVEVYLAICAKSIDPKDPLTSCVGGAVPDGNTGKAWALLTKEPAGKINAVGYGDGGSFSATLTVDAAVGSSVDCLSKGCVLVARSIGDAGSRPADITVGLGFVAPSSSSTTSTSDAPETVGPDAVALPSAQAGQQQTVVFTGYIPGEDVAVTIFSEPIDVPGIKASGGGIVTITFQIPTTLLAGQHTVQAIGAQSGLVGLASFAIVDPVVTLSSQSSGSGSASSAESSASSTSAPESTTSAAPSTTVLTTSDTAAVAPITPASSGRNLWWLWVTLALLLVAAGITTAVMMSRRRAQELEQERLDRNQQLAEASDLLLPPPPTPAPPRVYPPDQPWQPGAYNDPSQSHGLLSGHQGDGPALYSGQGNYPGGQPAPRGVEPATSRIPTPPTTRIPPPPVTGPAGPSDVDQPTRAFRPNFDTDPPGDSSADTPRTEQWSPFDDDDDDPENPGTR